MYHTCKPIGYIQRFSQTTRAKIALLSLNLLKPIAALQIQNSLARAVVKAPKTRHITPILHSLFTGSK